MTQTARIVVGVILMVISGGFLLPTGIAVLRDHPKVVSIILWNTLGSLLLGLGWLIALIISLTGTSNSNPQVVVQTIHNHAPSQGPNQ